MEMERYPLFFGTLCQKNNLNLKVVNLVFTPVGRKWINHILILGQLLTLGISWETNLQPELNTLELDRLI